MSLIDEQQLFAQNIAALLLYIHTQGYEVTFGEAYRTQEQSLIYAAQGKGIANSLHKKRLAIDLNIFTSRDKYLVSVDDYRQFGEYWEKLNPNNKWGGNFKSRPDAIHFQMSYQ